MSQNHNFTEGPILGPLLRFAVPVLFALFLQAMYGAVDLLVVGKFAASADVSAVSTGSQLMQTITGLISGLAMGVTVFLGQKIGEGNGDEGGRIVCAGIWMFGLIGAVLTILIAELQVNWLTCSAKNGTALLPIAMFIIQHLGKRWEMMVHMRQTT